MTRYSVDVRITQYMPTAHYRLSVNYYVDGVCHKTYTRSVRAEEAKALDATLALMLVRGAHEDVERWAEMPTLF